MAGKKRQCCGFSWSYSLSWATGMADGMHGHGEKQTGTRYVFLHELKDISHIILQPTQTTLTDVSASWRQGSVNSHQSLTSAEDFQWTYAWWQLFMTDPTLQVLHHLVTSASGNSSSFSKDCVCSSLWNIRKWVKSRNPVTLSVMYYHQRV